MQNQREYRNHSQSLSVVRGDVRRVVHGIDAKRRITRELHGVVLEATEHVALNVPTEHHDWAYDLRRGRMRVYGSLLRCIDLLNARGCPKETAMMIPQWIAWYVEETWSTEPTHSPDPVAGAIRLPRAA